MDGILHVLQLARLVPDSLAGDVPGSLQLLDGGTNGTDALLADVSQARDGAVPVPGQGEHHGQQSFGFQAEEPVPQMDVLHPGEIAVLLNMNDFHGDAPLRQDQQSCVSLWYPVMM